MLSNLSMCHKVELLQFFFFFFFLLLLLLQFLFLLLLQFLLLLLIIIIIIVIVIIYYYLLLLILLSLLFRASFVLGLLQSSCLVCIQNLRQLEGICFMYFCCYFLVFGFLFCADLFYIKVLRVLIKR